MHRRSLPIAAPCQVFRPTKETSFCDHCSTHVHDLSAMTKREAVDLLASNVGQKICVAYRTAADGTLLHRPEPIGRAAGPLMALGLAACAAHAPELEHPGEGCRDPQGYEVDCEQPRHGGDPMIPVAYAEAEETSETEELVQPVIEVAPPQERTRGGMLLVSPATMTQIEEDEAHDRKAARAARRAAERERRSR